MRTLRLFFVLGAIGISNILYAQNILTLHCQQMDPYIGKSFVARITEMSGGKEVGRKTISAIDTADFSFDLYVLLNGRNYNIDFYVDVNASGDYDSPPIDHVWRRVLNNASQNTTVTFIPDNNYSNTGMPVPFPYSTYNAIWGGKWMNLTFGSTDSIEAGLDLRCDSIFGSFSTAGVFGNPAPLVFNYANALPPDSVAGSDTVRFSLDPPWTGEIYMVNGELHGALNLMGVGLNFTGTVGAMQILALYTVIVGGNPFANGYFYVRELEILSSATELEYNALITDPSCYGACDGNIDLVVSGGQSPYIYSWNTGNTSEDLQNVCAGINTVTVSDVNGCTFESNFILIDPPILGILAFGTDVSCFGLCDGNIDLDVFGGPYDLFVWDSPVDVSALCAGDYVTTALNSNGCQTVISFTINSPQQLIITNITTIPETNGQSDGVITLSASGGVAPYQYSLDGGISYQASNIFTGLAAGTYLIYVRDSNGCITTEEVTIINLTSLNELKADYKLYPNPASSYLFLESDQPLSIEMINMQGRMIIEDQKSMSHRIDLDGIAPGVYVMRISDGIGVAYRKVVVE